MWGGRATRIYWGVGMGEMIERFPKVSVVIPAYNYERYVGAAVRSALAQTYGGEVEVLVVDDGSSDGTVDVVRGFGDAVHLVCRENGGLPAARNTGIREASGDYLVFLDADDELEPVALGVFMSAFKRLGDSYGVVACCLVETGRDGRITGEGISFSGDGMEVSYEDLILRNQFCTTVMAKRVAIEDAGLFDESLRACEDRDMWIRSAIVRRIYLLPDRLVRVRKHGENMTYDPDRQAGAILQVLEKSRRDPKSPVGRRSLLWRRAFAVMDYQDSFMQLRAGRKSKAFWRLVRSWWRWPYFRNITGMMRLPRFFRLLRLWRILKPSGD